MQTEILKVEGGSIAYNVLGDEGPTLILAPGIGDLRQEYRLLAPKLAAAGFRTVAIDLRGHGESSAGWSEYTPEAVGRDMLALARSLNVGPVWLAGCSMAAASAVWAAVEASDLVRGVIGLGPSLEDGKLTAFQSLALGIGLRGPWKVRFWLTFYRSLYPHAKPADFDAYCEQLRRNLAEPGRFDALQAFMHASKSACVARFPALDRPALVVMGSHDPDFANPAAKAQEYAEALRGNAIVLPNSGHYPHVDASEACADAIISWLRAQQGVEHGSIEREVVN